MKMGGWPAAAALMLAAAWAAAAMPPAPARARVLVPRAELSAWPAMLPYPDVEGASADGRNLVVAVAESDLAELAAAGLDCRPAGWLAGPRADRIDPGYLDPGEVEALLAGIEAAHGDIVQRVALGLTHEGRTIWAVKISDQPAVEDATEPEVLVMAGIRPREIMGVEIACDLVQTLADGYGSDPALAAAVDELQIWVVPMANPDGSAYCWASDASWTKNRRECGQGLFGVDIGRNFPFRWGACNGSSGDPASGAYRGPAPASEPETQALLGLADEHRFALALSFHSFGEAVVYPYGCQFSQAPDEAQLDRVGRLIAAVIAREAGGTGYSSGAWWETMFALDGADTDWLYAWYGTFAFAVYVNDSAYQPPYSQRQATVTANRLGWRKALEVMRAGPAIRSRLVDGCTGLPIQGIYSLEEAPLTSEETPRLTGTDGRFLYPTGSAHVTLLAGVPGYAALRQPLTVGAEGYEEDVVMLPIDAHGLALQAVVVDDAGGDGDGLLDPGETAYLHFFASAPALGVTGGLATIACDDPLIDILGPTTSFPDIPAGEGAWSLPPGARVRADAATPEGHVAEFSLTFSAQETLCQSSATFQLAIFSTTYFCPYLVEPFDLDPGWEIQNSGSGGWEFGEPQSGPGQAYTGQNVYATNLNGEYGDNGSFVLTSDPFDCTLLVETELRFQRWLRCEVSWDPATVSVSVNGQNWVQLWSGYAQDTAWTEQVHDISSIADGRSEVRARFALESDYMINDLGFYLDDVMVCGTASGGAPTATPTPTGGASTRTPTATPYLTPTPLQSATPTPTPTASPTGGPPPSPTPTPTPTGSTESFSVQLALNQAMYSAGDDFLLQCTIDCRGPAVTVDEYIILDVWGDYFFWPEWTPDLGCRIRMFHDGDHLQETILEFLWPPGAGQASELAFWVGCLDSTTGEVRGQIGHVVFGYR